uniref:Uncharacterized protein n=1 Tax=Rhizophora mucronata TaxID=61149 RepID=A0A2P2JC44_RHIMU
MAFLFNKFQQAMKVLAESPSFAKKNLRQLQFEADINRLFLYTSYNRLGKNAEEADAEEIIDMASKASVADQQKQVQENIHHQIQNFCKSMDEILLHNINTNELGEAPVQSKAASGRSGLNFAVGKSNSSIDLPAQLYLRLDH